MRKGLDTGQEKSGIFLNQINSTYMVLYSYKRNIRC
jgi:hypothetical protein